MKNVRSTGILLICSLAFLFLTVPILMARAEDDPCQWHFETRDFDSHEKVSIPWGPFVDGKDWDIFRLDGSGWACTGQCSNQYSETCKTSLCSARYEDVNGDGERDAFCECSEPYWDWQWGPNPNWP